MSSAKPTSSSAHDADGKPAFANQPYTDPLTKAGTKVYKAKLHVDRFVDEDYYGLRVCHWEIMAADFDMKVGRMNFSPGFFVKDVRPGNSVLIYLSKQVDTGAHNPAMPPFNDSGNPRREDYGDSGNTFSTMLTAEEYQQ
ncbi:MULTISPECIES: hypothetical protein [unclassified Dyella]|uniref:hypothetical protein n=1 Tax=unclassified Dyella TaxID=2634549 RepID=UPI0011AF5685|nr:MULTISPECIES: hypothetical protein [unclassified Dyella]MDR3444987.1 hypothetical protein [Dyella sp.]